MTHPQTAALIALLERVEAGHLTASCLPDSMVKNWQQIMDAYHGSLDAAKALHDAVLPGWEYGISQNAEEPEPAAYVAKWDAKLAGDGFAAVSYDPARAWLIAIIRALIADTEGR
jgi:hypothetical protein